MSVVIHTKSGCPYCDKAKVFFAEYSIPYEEVFYDPTSEDYEVLKNELIDKTCHRTFPQIFIGDKFLGGYTELLNAHSTLKLHDMLKEIGIELDYDF
jgi:glutaredoxin 3